MEKRGHHESWIHDYRKVDEQLHILVQLLARAGRSLAASKDDDSHTNLSLDPVGKRICGRWLQLGASRMALCLNLEYGKYEWINDKGRVIHSMTFEGYNMAQMIQHCEDLLKELVLNVENFHEKMHYSLPGYFLQTTPLEFPDTEKLSEWISWRSMANNICNDFLNHFQLEAEIRIWPHHFDTGCYASVNEHVGFGFGLAMYDEMTRAPYYYFTAYPSSGWKIDYDGLENLVEGEWLLSETWKGAVWKLTQPINTACERLHVFVREVGYNYLKQLKNT